jgi:hypothetical protein
MGIAKLIGLLSSFVPSAALAALVTSTPASFPRSAESVIVPVPWGTTFSAQSLVTARKLATHAMTVTRVEMAVHSGSGGGAGTAVIRLSDGTNTCDATFACTDTQTTGNKEATLSGTCAFPLGATVTVAFVAPTCTTTQPAIRSATVLGVVR